MHYAYRRIYASCLSANLCILFILFFKPPIWNWAETELRQSTNFILSCTDSWCLAPFSVNIACDSRHKVRLCFGCRMRTQCYICGTTRQVFRSGAHSKKMLPQSASSLVEVPLTAMLGRVNGASHCNLLTKCCYELRCMAKRSFRRKWKASVA